MDFIFKMFLELFLKLFSFNLFYSIFQLNIAIATHDLNFYAVELLSYGVFFPEDKKDIQLSLR